jgi:anti-sigma factor ChrR (cupin superfamily)
MPAGSTFVFADLARQAAAPDFSWASLRPGVDIHPLSGGSDDGPSSALLRYAPGASVPHHRHPGHEHIFVLAGMQVDANGIHRAGTLVINLPGSSHEVSSPDGCLVLAIWERPVVFT